MTDPGIAASLELQRRGYRVIVEQCMRGSTCVTVYLGRRDAPITSDVKASAKMFAAALAEAARRAGVEV